MNPLHTLTASTAASKIAEGKVSSEALVISCLRRIEQRQHDIQAWAYIDGEAALQTARALDKVQAIGPLHGIPVGIKDVIDTQDMPTTYGSSIYAAHRPKANATCIQLLEEAGAIILGKTVSAEFATYQPGATTNPHNTQHTPGGSSSGSAAAVADCQIPLTIGTQTAGSVIRPASFCGVVGFKPSKDRYDTKGMLDTSPHLDTLGTFSRSIEDAMLADDVLAIEPDIKPVPVNSELTLAVCKTSVWHEASADMQAAVIRTAERCSQSGFKVTAIELPASFDELLQAHTRIHQREVALCFVHILQNHPDEISVELKRFIASGTDLNEQEYQDALLIQQACKEQLNSVFASVDLLITPSAKGAAPKGLSSTGDPLFSKIWTTLGVPCLSFPAAFDQSMLPLGVQLAGLADTDREFLTRCRHVLSQLGESQ